MAKKSPKPKKLISFSKGMSFDKALTSDASEIGCALIFNMSDIDNLMPPRPSLDTYELVEDFIAREVEPPLAKLHAKLVRELMKSPEFAALSKKWDVAFDKVRSEALKSSEEFESNFEKDQFLAAKATYERLKSKYEK